MKTLRLLFFAKTAHYLSTKSARRSVRLSASLSFFTCWICWFADSLIRRRPPPAKAASLLACLFADSLQQNASWGSNEKNEKEQAKMKFVRSKQRQKEAKNSRLNQRLLIKILTRRLGSVNRDQLWQLILISNNHATQQQQTFG